MVAVAKNTMRAMIQGFKANKASKKLAASAEAFPT
jgi:hypothetical protein